MEKSAKRFTTLLCKQLLQDATLEGTPEVDRLKHSFQTGIDSLVDGELKSELINNFDTYFKQLQRSLSSNGKRRKKKGEKGMVEEVMSSSAALERRLLLVAGQLDQRLSQIVIIEDFNERCDQYLQLLLASSTNAEWQATILQNWTEHWNVDVLPIETAVRIVNCCTMIVTQEAKLDWLKLCIKMFTSFVEAASAGRGGSSKDNDCVRVKQLMWSCLYNSRPVACAGFTDPVKHEGTTYEDLASALLSLYAEYLLITEDKDHMITISSHVISLLFLLLGHARLYYYDVILQVTVDNLPHSLSSLLSLCRYVLDKTVDCQMDHLSFTKYLCCVITGHRISEQIESTEFKVKKFLPAPKEYVHWLCDSSPSLARQLNLKRFTANSEVATTVIHSPVKNVVEELLNLTDSNCIPEENVTPVKDIVTDKMSPLVETIQPSTPSDVIDNDHSIVVEKENNGLNEQPSDVVDVDTPTNAAKDKILIKQSTASNRKLHRNKTRRKRKTASLGFYVDTTPGHKDCVPPITMSGIKKKRRSWKTPQSTRYYMQQ